MVRRLAVAPLCAAALVAAACGPKRVAQPAPPSSTLVVLLPDPESGRTGRARATNEFGAADLAAPRAATRAASNGPPSRVTQLSAAEVSEVFGAALASLPPPPRHFTLNFQFESDALTPQSSAQIPKILEAARELAVPEVIVVGHTDTMGDRKANAALGLKRATTVRRILLDAGLSEDTVQVASHGEGDLLISTPDNTAEPRNRRVEITVR